MAVLDPTSVQHVDRRFHDLLARAKSIKPSNSIEPPLPASSFTGDEGLPQDAAISKVAHSTAVEIVARRIFQAQAATAEPLDSDFGSIWHLLDLLQILGDQDQCEPSILWYIVEELLDSRSIEGCRIIFDYLESRRERLVAKSFKKVNLVILRACNELLRRLSRAEDAVFCGRVFIFVFQSFPLGDKSSVNRQGEYNTDNVTTINSEARTELDSSAPQDTAMVDAEAELDANATEMEPTAQSLNDLHPRFWALQKNFANLPSVFDAENMANFKAVFNDTLAKFNSVTKVSSATGDSRSGAKRKAGDLDRDESANNYNPKYLTSRELFELELSDLAFQRHILVQAMILLEFLLSFTEQAKKKQLARIQQKYQFTLSDEDTQWVEQTKKAIVTSLRDGHDGPAFVRMVETVLSRDKNWVKWKEINCPEIMLPSLGAEDYVQATKTARSISAWRRIQTAGSLNLKFLDQLSNQDGLDAYSVQDRPLLPSTETLVNEVKTVDLDIEFASTSEETESLQQLKASNTWRALRVASLDKLAKFDKLTSATDLDQLLDRPEAEVEEVRQASAEDEKREDTGDKENGQPEAPQDTEMVDENKEHANGADAQPATTEPPNAV